MPTLPLIITDAGRQAIVDATNTGTLPITLTEVALGTGKWSPDATAVALQAEIKRINTLGGLVVAPDTIHVTITDASSDAYALGEFGLYTDGGVLFAIYSDLAGITDKAADALLLLANDIVLTSVPAGSVTVGSTEFINPPATETAPGVAEVATQAESDAGTDDARIVTPKKAKGSAAAYTYTANQALATPANTGTITQLVSWLAGRLMAITGKTDWKTAPATTLEAAKTHADSTSPHSATSAATASRLMLRDAAGRAKVSAPNATDDIARQDTVNAVGHQNVIEHSGQAFNSSDPTQLLEAIRRISGGHVTTITASATLTLAHAGVVLIDASAGNITVTLPAAAGMPSLEYTLVRVDGSINTATIAAAGGEAVGGAATLPLNVGGIKRLSGDGVNEFHVISGDELPYALVSSNTTQAVPNMADTRKSFTTVEFDDAGLWDAVNNQFIIPRDALVRITANTSWQANTSGVRSMRIVTGTYPQLPGVGVSKHDTSSLYTTMYQNVTSGTIKVNAGETLFAVLFQSSGGALNVNGVASYDWISAEVLRWL